MNECEHLKEIKEDWERKKNLVDDYQKVHKTMNMEETEEYLAKMKAEENRRVD